MEKGLIKFGLVFVYLGHHVLELELTLIQKRLCLQLLMVVVEFLAVLTHLVPRLDLVNISDRPRYSLHLVARCSKLLDLLVSHLRSVNLVKPNIFLVYVPKHRVFPFYFLRLISRNLLLHNLNSELVTQADFAVTLRTTTL